ncbi:MAG TPA: hypothetical protein VN854_00110, partial [Mycoplasmatales bacterium]|nr:hypothetical protein [Mycoplasmatales bacterium]
SKDSWCLIRWNTSNHMLFLFYKEKDCEFYTSSIRSHPATKEGIFVEFKKVETGSFEEKWMKKI